MEPRCQCIASCRRRLTDRPPLQEYPFAIVGILAVYALTSAIYQLTRKKNEIEFIYRQTRQRLGRGILLGLEFLVAADIIHTVAVELTFKTVGVLAIIVVIRTFLSFTLEVELTGKWPWQENGNK